MLIENQHFIGKKGADQFALRIGPEHNGMTILNCVIDGDLGDWGAKASKPDMILFENCIIKNGLERALDIVRGGNVLFKSCKFVNDRKLENGQKARIRVKSKWALGKECDIGLKAGAHDITFVDCEFNDMLLGDYSIYDQIDRPKTRRINLINCKNPNGGPIFIRGRYADKNAVVLTNTSVSMLIWPEFITKIYWAYNRKFGDRRPLNEEQRTITPDERL